MALNNEDKADVRKHMGKALANKVSKVTRDSNHKVGTKKFTHDGKEGSIVTRSFKSVADANAYRNKRAKESKYKSGLYGNSPYEKKAKSYDDDWEKADRAEMRRRKSN